MRGEPPRGRRIEAGRCGSRRPPSSPAADSQKLSSRSNCATRVANARGARVRPGSSMPPERRVLQGEEDLEERVDGELPLRPQLLDQLLEGEVLVGEGLEGGPPDAGEQLAERRVAREVAAQHQGVDEEADQRLDLRPVAAGDGRADGEVLLAGQPARAGPGRRRGGP